MRLTIDEERRLLLHDPPCHRAGPGSHRRLVMAFAVLDEIRELDQPRLFVEQPHVGDVGVERLARLLAHEDEQRLDLELRVQRLAHAVDRAQLGHALACLVDQAAGTQRNAQAGRDRGEQRDIGLVEGVLAIQVLQ